MAGISQWVTKQLNIVKEIGGYQAVWRRLLREGTVSSGTLIGEDRQGNKYYENETYFMGRSRFVEFPYKGRNQFDASQIPPEWHRWMQYMTDEPPSTHPPEERKFHLDHQINHSGSSKQYVPYSTTKPKIEAWQPSNN